MCLIRMVQASTLACLLALASPTQAVGPEQPLRFDADPVGKDQWVLPLIVEAERVSDLRVEWRLFRNGELLERRELKADLKPSPQYQQSDRKILRAQLPLRFDGMKKLEPGLYAQKFIVEGRRSDVAGSRPIHIERWSHFQVEKESVRLLSLEEYSALADSPETALDKEGRKVLVHIGISRIAEVPLPNTKASPAVPLGRLGGLVEEQPTDRKPQYIRREKDKSEIHED